MDRSRALNRDEEIQALYDMMTRGEEKINEIEARLAVLESPTDPAPEEPAP